MSIRTRMNVNVNGTPIALADASPSIAALVEQMALGGKRIAVELNGRIVSRSAYAQTLLGDGDRVEFVGAVGGG